MPAKRKILITGSSGMLGTDLCQELSKGYVLYGIDMFRTRNSESWIRKFYKISITNKKEIKTTVKKINPDVVIHAAAWTDVDGCEDNQNKAYRVNKIGTANIALACKETGAILIYISTDFVFDGKKKKPYKEADKVKPLSIYGKSKLKGEEAVKKILKKYYILRTSWLYGKNGKNFVDTIIAKANSEKVLKVVDDQVGSPTLTKDLSKAIHAVLCVIASPEGTKQSQNMQYGIYHVSNSGSVSWFDYAKEILKLAKSKTKVLPISSNELARPAKRPAMSILDNTKFIEFTGYKMRNWQEALKSYVRDAER